MATPIGHLLAGQLSYRAVGAAVHARWDPRLAWLCAFAALAPDLDLLPGILAGRPALYHQGPTHSLLVAGVVSGLLAALYARRSGGLPSAWIVLGAAYASHLGLDLLGPDRRPPFGIPLLWPFSDTTYLSPVTLLPGVRHAEATGVRTEAWIAQTLQVRNMLSAAVEAAVLAIPVAIAEIMARRRGRRSLGRAH